MSFWTSVRQPGSEKINYKENSSKKKKVENTRTLRKEPGSKSLSR